MGTRHLYCILTGPSFAVCIFSDGFLNIFYCEKNKVKVFAGFYEITCFNFGNPSETYSCDFYSLYSYRKPPFDPVKSYRNPPVRL
jgi:hypothetical protein